MAACVEEAVGREAVARRAPTDEHAPTLPHVDQPFGLELRDGLANRPTGDAVFVDEFALRRQQAPGRQLPAQDSRAQAVRELLVHGAWVGRVDRHQAKAPSADLDVGDDYLTFPSPHDIRGSFTDRGGKVAVESRGAHGSLPFGPIRRAHWHHRHQPPQPKPWHCTQ
jgi:hypothetical protein